MRTTILPVGRGWPDTIRLPGRGDVLDVGVEIVTLRATLRQPLPRRHDVRSHVSDPCSASGVPTQIDAFSFQRNAWREFALLDRTRLAIGERIAGPAIISEATATTYLDDGFTAIVDPLGSLIVVRS